MQRDSIAARTLNLDFRFEHGLPYIAKEDGPWQMRMILVHDEGGSQIGEHRPDEWGLRKGDVESYCLRLPMGCESLRLTCVGHESVVLQVPQAAASTKPLVVKFVPDARVTFRMGPLPEQHEEWLEAKIELPHPAELISPSAELLAGIGEGKGREQMMEEFMRRQMAFTVMPQKYHGKAANSPLAKVECSFRVPSGTPLQLTCAAKDDIRLPGWALAPQSSAVLNLEPGEHSIVELDLASMPSLRAHVVEQSPFSHPGTHVRGTVVAGVREDGTPPIGFASWNHGFAAETDGQGMVAIMGLSSGSIRFWAKAELDVMLKEVGSDKTAWLIPKTRLLNLQPHKPPLWFQLVQDGKEVDLPYALGFRGTASSRLTTGLKVVDRQLIEDNSCWPLNFNVEGIGRFRLQREELSLPLSGAVRIDLPPMGGELFVSSPDCDQAEWGATLCISRGEETRKRYFPGRGEHGRVADGGWLFSGLEPGNYHLYLHGKDKRNPWWRYPSTVIAVAGEKITVQVAEPKFTSAEVVVENWSDIPQDNRPSYLHFASGYPMSFSKEGRAKGNLALPLEQHSQAFFCGAQGFVGELGTLVAWNAIEDPMAAVRFPMQKLSTQVEVQGRWGGEIELACELMVDHFGWPLMRHYKSVKSAPNGVYLFSDERDRPLWLRLREKDPKTGKNWIRGWVSLEPGARELDWDPDGRWVQVFLQGKSRPWNCVVLGLNHSAESFWPFQSVDFQASEKAKIWVPSSAKKILFRGFGDDAHLVKEVDPSQLGDTYELRLSDSD